jgi:hypothetical protein
MNGSGTRTASARSYRWVRAWLIAGTLLALLLLANSILDYRFVSRILAVQQVRRQISQNAATLEQELRQNWTPGTPRLKVLSDEIARSGSPPAAWILLKSPDGTVIEQEGTPEVQPFSGEDEIEHFKNRQPLFDVYPTSKGEVVLEAFPLHGAPRHALDAESKPPDPNRPPPVITVEMAMPLTAADAETLWPIRRNLMINAAGALALLLTVVIAGLGFRSYVRGKQLEQQLEIAKQVQTNLLPKKTELSGDVQVAVEYVPAEEVGGDFYDVFKTKEGGTALVIGDVSGKGVPAALLMGVIHGAVRASGWTESKAQHESECVELNQLLCEQASGERYSSMFWCYSDAGNSVLQYVNAGHCPALLVGKRDGGVEVARLEAGGPVMGVLPVATYLQDRRPLRPGDVLVLYSDGLGEATNAQGDEYGEDRLRELLVQENGKSAEEIRAEILRSVREFLGAAAAHDDLTCVVARFGREQKNSFQR